EHPMSNRVVRWITVRLFQSTPTSIQASEDRRLKIACVVKDEEPTAIGGTNLKHIGENGVHELPICTRRRQASRSSLVRVPRALASRRCACRSSAPARR